MSRHFGGGHREVYRAKTCSQVLVHLLGRKTKNMDIPFWKRINIWKIDMSFKSCWAWTV